MKKLIALCLISSVSVACSVENTPLPAPASHGTHNKQQAFSEVCEKAALGLSQSECIEALDQELTQKTLAQTRPRPAPTQASAHCRDDKIENESAHIQCLEKATRTQQERLQESLRKVCQMMRNTSPENSSLENWRTCAERAAQDIKAKRER